MMMHNGQHPQLIAITRAVEIDTPTAFLRAFTDQPRVFWQRGQYASAYAGAGAAAVVRAKGSARFDDIQHSMRAVMAGAHIETTAPPDVRPRWLGGFAFAAQPSDDPVWSAFGSAQFILPRYLLTRVGGFHWLTLCDYGVGDRAQRTAALRAELDRVLDRIADEHPSPSAAQVLTMIERTDRDTWMAQVERGIKQIGAGALRKIVLARALDVQFDAPPDPLAALARLEQSYPTAYRFLIEPQPGAALFGATPELLVRLEDGELQTAALAGSAARSAAPDEDDRLAAELLASTKDRHEHALVADWLRARLEPISRALTIPEEPVVVKLKHIQHLYTPVQATLRARRHVLSIVERLHPTPALGGWPQREAEAIIPQIETLGRGWYAAPVGWVDGEGSGEFAVAIRSAVMCGDHVRLYAGAGIVADSDPAREWDETALKLKPMFGALGLAEASAQFSMLGTQPKQEVLSSEF